jgi:CRP-like cAMP-binding protein
MRRRSVIKSRSTAQRASKRPASGDGQVPSNKLLAALPAVDYLRLLPDITVIPLILKETLHKPGSRIDYVYFPGGGFVSELTVLADGGMVEVATIGSEGMVGVGAILDGITVPSLTMVQATTETCYRISATAFRREIDRHGALYELAVRYAQVLSGLVMQSTACNAVHLVEQRLARWLLMAHDRVGKNPFPLTQEFVAMMLGAARPTVTVVAGTLQDAGLITYKRGNVTIVDRKGLERASCECYRAVKDLLDNMITGSSSTRFATARPH